MENPSAVFSNAPLPLRAAQYVRMSTEHQQYSPENQLEVIRKYAAAHQMEIVQEYSDFGRSGLNIAGHDGKAEGTRSCCADGSSCSAQSKSGNIGGFRFAWGYVVFSVSFFVTQKQP